jgi:hypothetical protein
LKQAVLTIVSICACASVFGSKCQATTVQLGINGNAEIGSNYIEFGQYPDEGTYAPAPGYGSFQVSLVRSGVFATAGVIPGELGTIQSLNEANGSMTLSSPFMTFSTGGAALTLNATPVPVENFGFLILANTSYGAVVSFDVSGTVVDATNPIVNQQFTGTFAMAFLGETVAELLNDLPADAPFSATFNVTGSNTVPTAEPHSILLIALGLIGVGRVSRNWLRTIPPSRSIQP